MLYYWARQITTVFHSRPLQRILPLGIPRHDSRSENCQNNKYTKYNKTTDQINTYTKYSYFSLKYAFKNTLKYSIYPVITKILLVTPQIPTESHFTLYNPLIPSYQQLCR